MSAQATVQTKPKRARRAITCPICTRPLGVIWSYGTDELRCLTEHCPGVVKLMFKVPPGYFENTDIESRHLRHASTVLERARGYMDPREMRGLTIAETPGAVTRDAAGNDDDDGAYRVVSQHSDFERQYRVDLSECTCTCDDFDQRGSPETPCKHIYAVHFWLERQGAAAA